MITNRLHITSAQLNLMLTAALKAARGLIRDFGEVEHLQVSKKGPGNFVTRADRRAERADGYCVAHCAVYWSRVVRGMALHRGLRRRQ